jgi:hypothetical protein
MASSRVPLRLWLGYWRVLQRYHRYAVNGLEQLDGSRAALIVGYHGRPFGALGHRLQRGKQGTRDRIVQGSEPVVEHSHEAIGAPDPILVDQTWQTVAYRPATLALAAAQGAGGELVPSELPFELERPATCRAHEGVDVRGRHRRGRSHIDVDRAPQRRSRSKLVRHVRPPGRSTHALRGV